MTSTFPSISPAIMFEWLNAAFVPIFLFYYTDFRFISPALQFSLFFCVYIAFLLSSVLLYFYNHLFHLYQFRFHTPMYYLIICSLGVLWLFLFRNFFVPQVLLSRSVLRWFPWFLNLFSCLVLLLIIELNNWMTTKKWFESTSDHWHHLAILNFNFLFS